MDQRRQVAYDQGRQAARRYKGFDFVDVPNATTLQDRKWVAVTKSNGDQIWDACPVVSSRAACTALVGNMNSEVACWAKFPSENEAFEWQAGFWREWFSLEGQEPEPEPVQ